MRVYLLPGQEGPLSDAVLTMRITTADEVFIGTDLPDDDLVAYLTLVLDSLSLR